MLSPQRPVPLRSQVTGGSYRSHAGHCGHGSQVTYRSLRSQVRGHTPVTAVTCRLPRSAVTVRGGGSAAGYMAGSVRYRRCCQYRARLPVTTRFRWHASRRSHLQCDLSQSAWPSIAGTVPELVTYCPGVIARAIAAQEIRRLSSAAILRRPMDVTGSHE